MVAPIADRNADPSETEETEETDRPIAGYGTLVSQVQSCQGLLAQWQRDITADSFDRAPLADLQASLMALQDVVRQVLEQGCAQDADKPPRLAAIDIEIRKQLRLIQIDSQFLKTARQPSTLTERLESIQAHLELLDRYGQGALMLLDRA
jgi:hypothetical protein